MISGGSWAEDLFEGRRGYAPSPQTGPFQKAYTPPPFVEDYNDYGYDYDYEVDEFLAPPPPPPMMRRPMVRPRGMEMQRGGMGMQRGGFFKSAGTPPPAFMEETRFRSTPPPPALVEEMTRFRRSPVPPAPLAADMARFRGMPPPQPGLIGARGMAVRRSSGFAAAAPAATTAVVSERLLAGEIISEEIIERPIGYEVWEEDIVRPVVTPIMQTVVRQEPMVVEKRITQETVAPRVVQETGMAAATTVVENSVAAPTVVQEMGMAAPTVVREMGMAAPPTFVQEGYAAAATIQTAVTEPRLMSEWETRPPTVVREMDATLPPVAAGGMMAGMAGPSGYVGLEQAPIVVDDGPQQGPIVVNDGPTTMTTSMRPPVPNQYGPQGTYGGIGVPPVPANMGPPPMGAPAFGGPADLNNLAVDEPRARGFKRFRQKMHRH